MSISRKLALYAMIGLIGALPAFTALAASKNKRDSLTPEQKKELRKRGMEWCRNTFRKDGYTHIERVVIREDGRIVCYLRR